MWARGCGPGYGELQGEAEGLIQTLFEQGHMKIIIVDLISTCMHHLMLVLLDQMKLNLEQEYQGLHKQK